MIDQDDMTGRQVHCKNKINMIKQWSPPPIRWKWNTSALELEPGIQLQSVLYVKIIMGIFFIAMVRVLVIVQSC